MAHFEGLNQFGSYPTGNTVAQASTVEHPPHRNWVNETDDTEHNEGLPTGIDLAPPEGIDIAVWADATPDERREIAGIKRQRDLAHAAGVVSHAEAWNRLNEQADPATMAALDALDRCVDADRTTDVAFSPSDSQYKEETRHAVCAKPMRLVGRRADGFVVGPTSCDGRKAHKCPHCSSRWQVNKLAGLAIVFDSLRSGDLDAPDSPIYVGTCREDEWRAVSTRMRRHGHGWFPVPTVNEHGEQERLILTTDPTIGVPRPESVALAMAEQELESLTLRPDETRHVRYAQDWRDIIDAHTVTPAEVEDDQPIEWIGAATNAETPAKIAKAAKRAGGMAGPIASAHDEAPETAPMWLAKIPAQTEWQFLGLIGFKTFAELTEERAIRRDRIEFEQAIRNSQRSRPAKAAA